MKSPVMTAGILS